MDTRKKDVNWRLNLNSDGTVNTEQASLAVLMDIRDQLQKLNSLLHCSNFQAIPRKLDSIRKNTNKPRKRKKVTQ